MSGFEVAVSSKGVMVGLVVLVGLGVLVGFRMLEGFGVLDGWYSSVVGNEGV
jgi:hypothetical protein